MDPPIGFGAAPTHENFSALSLRSQIITLFYSNDNKKKYSKKDKNKFVIDYYDLRMMFLLVPGLGFFVGGFVVGGFVVGASVVGSVTSAKRNRKSK